MPFFGVPGFRLGGDIISLPQGRGTRRRRRLCRRKRRTRKRRGCCSCGLALNLPVIFELLRVPCEMQTPRRRTPSAPFGAPPCGPSAAPGTERELSQSCSTFSELPWNCRQAAASGRSPSRWWGNEPRPPSYPDPECEQGSLRSQKPPVAFVPEEAGPQRGREMGTAGLGHVRAVWEWVHRGFAGGAPAPSYTREGSTAPTSEDRRTGNGSGVLAVFPATFPRRPLPSLRPPPGPQRGGKVQTPQHGEMRSKLGVLYPDCGRATGEPTLFSACRHGPVGGWGERRQTRNCVQLA